jgi:5-methylcytosine-specific restriction endonuclease McrA
MKFDASHLDSIYTRTSGYCHLCHVKLARRNYGKDGMKGAWQVEHSVPRSKGGTDHTNNLFTACVRCNLNKSNMTTRTARSWNDKRRSPLAPEKRAEAKVENAIAGAVVCGVVGVAVAGPVGLIIGVLTGASFGASENPDR